MITQAQYWAMFNRWEFLDQKDDDNLLSTAEDREYRDLGNRMHSAYMGNRTLWRCTDTEDAIKP